MPTISISYKDLCDLLAKVIPVKELKDKMFLQKMEAQKIVSSKGCKCNTKLVYNEAKDEHTCPECGYGTRDPTSAFCPRCRCKMIKEGMQFLCPTLSCGYKTNDPREVAFCPNCSSTIEYDITHDVWTCPRCKRVDPDAERYDSEWTVEVTFDRPDLLSTDGIARELKGVLDIETGIPKYEVRSSKIELYVDSSVRKVRPFIKCAVLRNIECSEDFIRQMMQLQEKLHESFCRERRKASIGIYDLDSIKSFPIRYAALPPQEVRFVPLEETRSMTGIQILQETQKGTLYAHLLRDLDGSYSPLFPFLKDSSGMVLSLPPIINSEKTKVTPETRNFFIDVTGLDENVVSQVLNIVVANLNERHATKGGEIRTVEIHYNGKVEKTPNLTCRRMILHRDYSQDILGLVLSSSEIVKLLRKMRLGVKKLDENNIEVIIPAYRADFLHEIDIIEDLAIAYGYSNFKHSLPAMVTIGKALPIETITSKIGDAMIGLGFQQILTYVMTSPEVLFRNMRLPPTEVVEVSNPKSTRFRILRTSLLPSLLEFLSVNQGYELPQKIFEIGNVVMVYEMQPNKARTVRRIAGVISQTDMSFEHIQAVVYNLLRFLGLHLRKTEGSREKDGKIRGGSFIPRQASHPSFIKGRVAEVIVDGLVVGILGEIHPEVILNFGISNPVSGFELNLTSLLKRFS